MNQIQVRLQEFMGSDRRIAEAAWTSSNFKDNHFKKTPEDVAKLIKVLANNKHSTPFESVIFRFWMKIPIQTDRQIMTHRIASHNGMSGRYRTMPSEYLDVPEDILILLENLALKWPNPTNTTLDPISEYIKLCETTNNFYNALLTSLKTEEKIGNISNYEYKRLREFFRGVLPQNNMTERVTIMNLRSFANFQKLRNSEHAQPEIQNVAQKMLEVVKEANVCPLAIESLQNNNWNI